ncbi:hypothetical protein GCM10011491_34680 [Brucella endophytica]|uniref:Uncharacterized protein n=1 Tax=Brucella endophytica TaxID=1963359 RepID=A0A916SMF8_9HYPH|nr:hypothetical protein [Brucella endophytica]GGB03573.1 hypothetical protein GCM10011491_34680 [Brucella endophytica]
MLGFFLVFFGIIIVVMIFSGIVGAEKDKGRRDEFRNSYDHVDNFNPQHIHVDRFGGSNVAVDTTAKKFALGRKGMGSKIYTYDDLIAVDVRRNGRSIFKTNRGSQAAGAAVGAALLGPAGLLIGGLTGSQRQEEKITELSLRLTVNNEMNHSQEIIFFRNSVGLDAADPMASKFSRELDNWQGRFQFMMRNK